jgi:hypothetical protein
LDREAQARPGGNEWVVNNAQTVASQSLMMTGAPLSVSYNAVGGATENSGFFEIQQNGDFNYSLASLTYARGTAAESLGLTEASGAFDSTPDLIVTPRFAHACPTERFTKNCTSVASFMDNLVQTENDQWSSFQDVYNPTSATPPGERASLEAWDQSSGGNYTFLENSSSTTPPIVDSMVASDARLLATTPEPSTWTMVVLGFAGLGLARYRTKTIKESTATQGSAP